MKSNLDNFIEEIFELQLAKELLNQVWLELGPYTHVISDELSRKLNNYFDFDDSE